MKYFLLIALLLLPLNAFAQIPAEHFDYQAAVVPSDEFVNTQKYLETINAYDGWDINHTAADVVIAVIDSGIDINHPDLSANVWTNPKETVNGIDDDVNGYIDDIHGWDFLTNSNDVNPKYEGLTPENSIGIQHATGVAGLIAAVGNNNKGISGVAWEAKLMSLRVLNEKGGGSSANVTKALQYAIAMRVSIINLSLVGTEYDEVVVRLLEQAYEQGIIIVSAAGNFGIDLNESPTYPICYNDLGKATIIGVAAIDDNFQKPNFSNYGDDCVDIVAPGTEIYTTRHVGPNFTSQEYYAALFSGTSFAVPLVTGTIALIKQMAPQATAEDILFLLQQGSTRLKSDVAAANSGYQYALNVAGTLSLAQEFRFLDTSSEISNTQPKIILPNPKFIVYPLQQNNNSVYRYEFPGPVLTYPAAFTEDALKGGMRFAKEHEAAFFVNSFKPGSKQLWRYNPFTNALTLYLVLPFSDPQTIGNVAFGNIDFDAGNEIIIGSGPDSDPYITVYNERGALKYQFLAYDQSVRSGLDVAVTDINGDGIGEVVAVPENQGRGEVKFFEYTGLQLRNWFVYPEGVNTGASVNIADVNADGKDELLFGRGSSGGPEVRILDAHGATYFNFFAGNVNEQGGADVQYLDLDEDGTSEYVVSYKAGHLPILKLYNDMGELKQEIGVFDLKYSLGLGLIML